MFADCLNRLGLLVVASGLLGFSGCSDDGLGRRYRVTGVVTYKGQPLEKGEIHFSPVDARGRAATGTIVAGRYDLTTNNPDDGALPGQYRVSILAKEVDIEKAKKDVSVKRKSMTEAQRQRFADENPQLVAIKAIQKAKDLIPARYSSPETSKLTAEVKEESNQRDFDLKDE